MKLAAIYNAWDGLELLPDSIKSIRHEVDKVIVVWQEWSNWGEKNNDIREVMYDLYQSKLVDELINVEPQPNQMSWQYAQRWEKKKRQEGINAAKDMGCTHFIGMDCDEFYDPIEFSLFKSYVETNCSDLHTCARIRVYYKEPTLCLDKLDDTFVPFICPLPASTGVLKKSSHLIDPTRITAAQYKQVDILMHHLSWVRKNGIECKLRNSTARKNIYKPDIVAEFENAKEGSVLQHVYPGRKLIRTENEFVSAWFTNSHKESEAATGNRFNGTQERKDFA